MLPSTIKTKVDCCFADDIYNVYLQNRYGINNCIEKSQDEINELFLLKKTYNFYYETILRCDTEMNPIRPQIKVGDCSINKLIEKISLL